MKNILYALLISLLLISCSTNSEKNNFRLWYKQPAAEWMEATPIGNGRLGAMVYGGVEEETIALNESTMWSGQFDEDQEKPFGKERMSQLRQLFLDGKIVEGNNIAAEHLKGNYNSFGTHLPVGDLKLKFVYPEGEVTDYVRELNIENAINSVSFKKAGIKYTREYFATNPDDVVIVKLSADKANAFSFDMSLDMLRESDINSNGNQLFFTGKVSFPMHGPGGVTFEGDISLSTDGEINSSGEVVSVKNASNAVIAIDIRTDYKNPSFRQLATQTVQKALAKKYEDMKKAHIADYSNLFKRVDISLGHSGQSHLPTDVRWKQVKDGKDDVELDALFFQYARYLLIAASRENSPLPASLQAIWNDNLACNMSWTNDYHLDINTQQNYWIANVGNLAECHVPLFNYINDLSVHGAKTAQKVYGCGGWTAHTVANVWGYTAPSQSISWGLFPTAGSWIASHLWTQYVYTQDKAFLSAQAYPLLKGNAEFLLEFMFDDPKTGYLMSGPSISPENGFAYDGRSMSASLTPACDRQLAHEIFTYCIEASEILNVDKEFADRLRAAVAKLPPVMIGKNGAIQEWFEDFDEAHPNHRHTTHLLAFYPFAQITLEKTPELAQAVRKTIEYRLAAEGWEDTEWSRANMICFYARLKDADEAYRSLHMLEQTFTRENLMTISPKGIALAPYDIFIFDGNPAGAAGIAEMLLQHYEGYIEFLPALPQQWQTGYFKGLCVPGGGVIDLKWKNSNVENAVIKATAEYTFSVKLPDAKTNTLKLNGNKVQLTPDANGIVSVKLNPDDIFEIM